MALHRGQAWLTCVTRDDAVISALVLAESLRRTKTTRRIGCIVSQNLSKLSIQILRKGFDDLFMVDKQLVENFKPDEYLGCKIFSLGLECFEKCVFLGTNSFILEHCDKVFDDDTEQYKDFSGNWDIFRFAPNSAICDYLQEQKVRAGFAEAIENWRNNNQSNLVQADEEDGPAVLRFSLNRRRLELAGGDVFEPLIAQLVDVPENEKELVGKLVECRDNPGLGLTEKAIIREWLTLYENRVARFQMDPREASRWARERKSAALKREPIAIIGLSCRFPGAQTPEQFWDLLYAGQESIGKPPIFRWTKEQTVTRRTGNEMDTEAGFLSDPVDEFDPKFFGLSPKDTELVDPQGRLLHEVMWEALENGGIDPQSLYGSHTGIFTGSWMNDYKDIIQASTEKDFFRTYMGNSIGATAARLSFLLGLTGPSIATESGCSSAIVALDLAVKSLRNGETNLAIAGGVNLLLHPFDSSIIELVIAPNGRCKTFDEKADGFGRAEGCGVLVLKRLSDALRDRDNIWALIRGSAVSQEGISRSLGTPTVHCEALAMELALRDGNVKPEQVHFVETHGTGTSVGDPMEVAAIAKAYHSSQRKEPLILGSVKTNVGHTESCSGITGIIKTVLAMQHQLIPKHLNLQTINPNVNLEAVPARIPIQPIAWPKVKGQPRLAGVSSFGITGTDGHVIIQEAPENTLPKFTIGLERPLHLIKFSAKTNEALDAILANYLSHLQAHPNPNDSICHVAYTANTGRAAFQQRAFILAATHQDVCASLQANKFIRGETFVTNDSGGKICFLFTGQGSQYPGMALELYTTNPVFRFHFDRCHNYLQDNYNLNVKQVLWENPEECKNLSRTIYSQTSIFVIEYCLLKLWESWGIKPDYVLGHSLGEFCAAVAAGLLTFEEALMLVAERSRLIDNLSKGAMLVIKANRSSVVKIMTANNLELDFAALNTDDQTVVAGDTERVQRLKEICKENGVKCVILEASHAFHSYHMDPILNQYRKVAAAVKPREVMKCGYISGLKGCLIKEPSQVNPDYWVEHTREKVNFLEACAALGQLEIEHYLELGPQPVLSSFVMQNIEDFPVHCFPSLRRGQNDWQVILNSLGRLFLQGYKINWEGYDKPYIRQKVDKLPYYPLNRKPFWVDCALAESPLLHPLVGVSMASAAKEHVFQNDVALKGVPYLKDHCIGHLIVFPGAGFTEMCMAAGYCVANGFTERMERPGRGMAVEEVRIEAPLEMKETKGRRLQTVVGFEEGGGSFECRVYHQSGGVAGEEAGEGRSGGWVLHASARFIPFVSGAGLLGMWEGRRGKVEEMVGQGEGESVEGFYRTVDNAGLRFGESFRGLQRYWWREGEGGMDNVVGEMKCPEGHEKYLLHPLIIDTMMQTAILSGWRVEGERSGGGQGMMLRVPVRIGRLTLLNSVEPEQSSLLLEAVWSKEGSVTVVVCRPEDFTPVAVMEDLELIETNVKTIQSVLEQQNSKIPDSWEETWKPIHSFHDNRVELGGLEGILGQQEVITSLEEKRREMNFPEDKILLRKINRLCYLLTLKALFQLGWEPKRGEELGVEELMEGLGITKVFKRQVRYYLEMFEEEGSVVEVKKEKEGTWRVIAAHPHRENIVDKESREIYMEIRTQDRVRVITEIYWKIGANLAEILSGRVSVLNLLFPMEGEETAAPEDKTTAADYYCNYPGHFEIMAQIGILTRAVLQKWRDQNPGEKRVVRVLEVGAGTGTLTMHTEPIFLDVWGNQFEFYFTDISASFFGRAEKKFEKLREHMKFLTFNIEQPPLEQGVPVNYFDLVVATDVLHATKNLRETLRNLRQTLRPGGVLCVTETLQATMDKGVTFVFGLFEGYWLFQDYDVRRDHTCVEGEVWRKLCLETGYKFASTTEAYGGCLGCISAEAGVEQGWEVRVEMETNERRRWVVFAPQEEDKDMEGILEGMRNVGNRVKVVRSVEGMEEWEDEKIYEHFMEGNLEGTLQGIVYAWGAEKGVIDQRRVAKPFLQLAKWLLNSQISCHKAPKLFVVTRDTQAITEAHLVLNPTGSTLFGMAKSLKNESGELAIRVVDLQSGLLKGQLVDMVMYELAMSKELRDKERLQVVHRDLVRYEPKFCKGALAQEAARSDLQLPPCTERYQLVLPKSKLINDLAFDVLLEGGQELGAGELEIQTKAYALNFRDILTILKPIDEFENYNNVGLDFAGVVLKMGESVQELQVGDRVFGLKMKHSPLPSHVVMEEQDLIKIPEGMTFAEAATLPAVFATSFYCLLTVARMKKGDVVLIHTGSGGVGLSAIQLAQHVGAKIICTAGSPRKRQYLRELGIEHVFRSRDTSYKENILRVTEGRGVDIVLNSITGPGFKEATLECCGQGARFVEMSRLSVWTPEEVRERRPDVEYSLVDLTQLTREVFAELLGEIKECLERGIVRPIPYVRFDALRIRQALQHFQKAKHIGKVVVVMPEQIAEGGRWNLKTPLFSPEGTYVITGGLGGIGFEVCKWMLEKGAKDLVLVGRNPPTKQVAQEIEKLNNLPGKDYNVMVKLADVGNWNKCRELISWIKNSCKPIRGVQHCAGVLQDNMIPNQSWSSVEATYNPKVEGTWNLHNLTLDCPLETFILFSSLTAMVGTPGQVNHASANCFEDAFANYRYCKGLPCTSINWGQWSQVGVAREVNVSGVLPVSVKRMLNGLEEILRSNRSHLALAEFESLHMWNILCPTFKYYVDERLVKNLKGGSMAGGGAGGLLLLKTDQFWQEIEEAQGREEKLEVVMEYMKVILRNALRMEPDEPINNDVNIKDLGVDSLMLIELKNSIQGLLGSRLTVTANMLKDCNTIRDLAGCIVGKLLQDYEDGEEEGKEQQLSSEELFELLTEDCKLEEGIGAVEGKGVVRLANVKTVLVTGVTGQLGPYMLKSLFELKGKGLQRVVCLVRVGRGKEAREKLEGVLKGMGLLDKVDMGRVECLKGDATQPMFGLEKGKYLELAESIEVVVHLAARSNHLEAYRQSKKDFGGGDVRSVNVGGTLNVLRFCSVGRTKHIFYASSILCVMGGEIGTLSDNWPEEKEICVLSDNKLMGYACSKFVSEMLLKAAIERGIPCKAFRFPWILGDSKTGQLNYLHNHYILRFLSYLKIKAIPENVMPAIVLSVDICADLSSRLFWNEGVPSNEVFVICHPNPEQETEFVRIAREDYGVDLELMDWNDAEFMSRLYDKGMPLESFKGVYEDSNEMQNYRVSADFRAIQGYLLSPESFFKNKKVERYLPGWADGLPETMEMIKKNLKYVRAQGFLDKFGIVLK